MIAPQRGIYRPDADGHVQLVSSRDHHSKVAAFDKPAMFAGLGASSVTLGALFVAVPPVAVGAAVGAGVACSGFAVTRGIQRLFNRKVHEQPISLDDREARNVWLGVAGNTMGLAAGAATQGVQFLARNGNVLHKFTAITVTSLQMASIATNGLNVANGFYRMFEVHLFAFYVV